MKKIKNIFKIFLALTIVFSQLSNATLVLADELSNNETNINDNNQNENDQNENDQNENDENDENDQNENDENDQNDEEEVDFSLENLETLMNAYLNDEELDEVLKNLLTLNGAPCIVNEEFTELTFDDIMFVNELLKENSDTETEREENEYLELELGEIPEEVYVGDSFDVEVIVSNEIINELSDEEESDEPTLSEDFIDGIEGLITTSDNLKVTDINFNGFTNVNDENGNFIACGDEYSEDNGVLFTITFEAIEEGTGEVTISGNTYKFLTSSDFELSFSTLVLPANEVITGLSSLNSDIGEFDKEFDNDTTEYTLTVPAGTTEITLSGALINEEDDVTGLSSYTIDEDNMTITIVVTSSNGDKTYTINVVREANTEEENEVVETEVVEPVVTPVAYYVYSSNSYLKSLSIKDYDIDFNKDTLEYKIKVKSDVKFLDITAVAEDYRSRVEINGNENFKEGENTVTIKVTAEDGTIKQYKLSVNKESVKDSKVTEEENGKAEKIIIIILIILVVLGLLYLIFKKDEGEISYNNSMNSNGNNKKNKER